MKCAVLCVAVVLVIAVPIAVLANPTVYPLGTTIYKPDKCWNGFTILSADKGYLIDMNGNLVHLWKGKLHHPNKVYPGGYLLTSTASWRHGRQDAIEIQIRDFSDRVLWKFDQWQQGKVNEGEGLMDLRHRYTLNSSPVNPCRNCLDSTI